MSVRRWPAELRAAAIQRFADGYSASQVAGWVSRQGFPVTRNAVISIVNRAGLKRAPLARASTPQLKPTRRQASPPPAAVGPKPTRAAPAPRPPTTDLASTEPVVADRAAELQSTTLVHLHASSCRFPVGRATGADHLFCGRRRAPGEKAYCAAHLRVAVSKRVAVA